VVEALGSTARTRLHRAPKRAVSDRSALHAILDEGLICHVGFVAGDTPVVIPTGYGRVGERLYLHGSPASRMVRALGAGAPACVTVTLLDGLVLARSAFHHSMNYRSAVVFGVARPVTEPEEHREALRRFTDHIVAGRWDGVRQPNARELGATAVLALELDEASVKVRTGPPVDDDEDYALPIWAGVVPLALTHAAPIPDPRLLPGLTPPAAATAPRPHA